MYLAETRCSEKFTNERTSTHASGAPNGPVSVLLKRGPFMTCYHLLRWKPSAFSIFPGLSCLVPCSLVMPWGISRRKNPSQYVHW